MTEIQTVALAVHPFLPIDPSAAQAAQDALPRLSEATPGTPVAFSATIWRTGCSVQMQGLSVCLLSQGQFKIVPLHHYLEDKTVSFDRPMMVAIAHLVGADLDPLAERNGFALDWDESSDKDGYDLLRMTLFNGAMLVTDEDATVIAGEDFLRRNLVFLENVASAHEAMDQARDLPILRDIVQGLAVPDDTPGWLRIAPLMPPSRNAP